MFELLPFWMMILGLIVACLLYARALRELSRAEADPAGCATLTRGERKAIRDLERQLARTFRTGPWRLVMMKKLRATRRQTTTGS